MFANTTKSADGSVRIAEIATGNNFVTPRPDKTETHTQGTCHCCGKPQSRTIKIITYEPEELIDIVETLATWSPAHQSAPIYESEEDEVRCEEGENVPDEEEKAQVGGVDQAEEEEEGIDCPPSDEIWDLLQQDAQPGSFSSALFPSQNEDEALIRWREMIRCISTRVTCSLSRSPTPCPLPPNPLPAAIASRRPPPRTDLEEDDESQFQEAQRPPWADYGKTIYVESSIESDTSDDEVLGPSHPSWPESFGGIVPRIIWDFTHDPPISVTAQPGWRPDTAR